MNPISQDACFWRIKPRTPQAGEAEPVAWMSQGGDVSRSKLYFEEMGFTDLIPLYTAPPRPVCDGNHAAPARADPECWQRPSPVSPVWQPIETAPRDGTQIIGFWQGTARPAYCIVVWDRQRFRHYKTKASMPITHWLPVSALPSPPDSPGATEANT